VQHRLLTADDEGVASIVAALESRYCRDPVCEEVDNLAFALVTPLGADDDNASTHVYA
jgi:hypothetical protein